MPPIVLKALSVARKSTYFTDHCFPQSYYSALGGFLLGLDCSSITAARASPLEQYARPILSLPMLVALLACQINHATRHATGEADICSFSRPRRS